jgi:hypothetical protein
MFGCQLVMARFDPALGRPLSRSRNGESGFTEGARFSLSRQWIAGREAIEGLRLH